MREIELACDPAIVRLVQNTAKAYKRWSRAVLDTKVNGHEVWFGMRDATLAERDQPPHPLTIITMQTCQWSTDRSWLVRQSGAIWALTHHVSGQSPVFPWDQCYFLVDVQVDNPEEPEFSENIAIKEGKRGVFWCLVHDIAYAPMSS